MQIPGHLAVALAQSSLPLFPRRPNRLLIPLLIASLFPDIVDKTIGYIFNAMPNGRHYAHNIFSLIGSAALITLIWGKTFGYAWLNGYLGHLLVDSTGMVPWFFPLKKYPFEPGQLMFRPLQLLQEMALLILVLIIRRAG